MGQEPQATMLRTPWLGGPREEALKMQTKSFDPKQPLASWVGPTMKLIPQTSHLTPPWLTGGH